MSVELSYLQHLISDMGRIANIGHNEPCHCGSSKKYKNCCLAKDEAAARAKAMADARAAETARQAAPAAQGAQQEQAVREWGMGRQAALPLDDGAPESEEPREPGLAPLPPNEQRLVNDWWEEVGPVYTGKGGKDKCGWFTMSKAD